MPEGIAHAMITAGVSSASTWTMALAAGAGRRLSSVTGQVPKQFWRPTGGTSLIEDTLERFSPVASPSRTVVVVDRTHRVYVSDIRGVDRGIHVVYQPEDRGTAAGVLLGLMPILDAEPEGIVAVTPSDHGVMDEDRFRQGVNEAETLVRSRDGVVLFGIEPDEARDDYGWITTSRVGRSGARLRAVEGFIEKPSRLEAERLLAAGAAWNTMVMVARASALWAMHRAALPALTAAFDALMQYPPPIRSAYLAKAYRTLPYADFSRDVLTPTRNLSAYIWPAKIGWSDLGTPERLSAWRERQDRHATALDDVLGQTRPRAGQLGR
jgi:mannose-1-phosphate guanylyltransferase